MSLTKEDLTAIGNMMAELREVIESNGKGIAENSRALGHLKRELAGLKKLLQDEKTLRRAGIPRGIKSDCILSATGSG